MWRNLTTLLLLTLTLVAGDVLAQIITSVHADTIPAGPSEPGTLTDSDIPPIPALPESLRGDSEGADDEEDLHELIAPSPRDSRLPDNPLRFQRGESVFGRSSQSSPDTFDGTVAEAPESIGKHLDLRFLIEWGGASAEWQGEISLEEGVISNVDHLGVEPMAPGGWSVEESSLRFQQSAPRTFDAIGLSIRAPKGASFHLRLTADGVDEKHVIPLQNLISEPFGVRLGASCQLAVRRAPGDSLRVRLNRPSLIFEPSEHVAMTVVPNAADNDPDAAHRCRLQLLNPRTGLQLWTSELDTLVKQQDTSGEIGPFTVPMPREEGIYNLVISLGQRDASTPLKSAGWSHTRTLQFVVLAKTNNSSGLFGSRGAPPSQGWQIVQAIDPTAEDIVVAKSPVSVLGQRAEAQQTFGARIAAPQEISGRKFATLAPGGWIAFPIELDPDGSPHRLEVEYPGATAQQFGLAIVEPTADGRAMRTSLDTGIDVAPLPDEALARVASAETVFWPRSDKALVVVTNRSVDEHAVVGSIRIHAGPLSLVEDKPKANRKERLVAAKLSASELTNLLGSKRVRDAESGRFLIDWQTFWTAAERLTQVLHDRGYNAAVIEVAGDGGTLYPTELLPALTRYDNGVLFTSGQDLVRKDVLELLFRIFDRQGLRLIPSIRFSTPLHELEERVANGEDGILLVDKEHFPWHIAHPDAAVGPLYNPLNDHVQRAMSGVVEEIVERYGDHESFAGVSLDLSADTYARLPGANWGMDSATADRFATALGSSGKPMSAQSPRQWQAEIVAKWLDWRAADLASFYNSMYRELADSRPELQLFLAGDLLEGLQPPSQASLDSLPTPTDVATLLLEQGIAPEHFAAVPGIALLRPLDSSNVALKSYDAEASQTREIVQAFLAAGEDHQGGLLQTRARPHSLASPRGAEFLGVDDAQIRLHPYLGLMGARGAHPLTHLLASHDCKSVFVRGLTRLRESNGLSERVTALLRELPNKPLSQRNQAATVRRAQPLTIRWLVEADQTRLYVANDSPWPIRATLNFQSPTPYRITHLSTGEPRGTDEDPRWQLSVPPYDVASCTLSEANVRIADLFIEHGEGLTDMLETEIDRLERHVSRMRPWHALENASFEASTGNNTPAGWRFSEGADQQVSVDPTQAADGQQSLLMQSHTPAGQSRGPVAWLRSQNLQAPASRRLAFQAQLRIADPRQQPRVRLVVEGEADGKRFYRQTEYGGGQGLPPLSKQWQRVGILVDDFPTGEVRNLRVGLDLRGTGQVSIDDVRLFDVWLTRPEATQVSEQLRLASVSLAEGRFQDCRYTLQRVGPQYLRHHFSRFGEGERFDNAPAETGEPIQSRQERLHREIARDPAAVMTSGPIERPAPREISERRYDPNQDPVPRVIRNHRPDVGQQQGMVPVHLQHPQRLPRPQAARPLALTEESGMEAPVEEKSGVSNWFNKIFRFRKAPPTLTSEPDVVLPEQLQIDAAPPTARPPASNESPSRWQRPRRYNSLFRQFRRASDEPAA